MSLMYDHSEQRGRQKTLRSGWGLTALSQHIVISYGLSCLTICPATHGNDYHYVGRKPDRKPCICTYTVLQLAISVVCLQLAKCNSFTHYNGEHVHGQTILYRSPQGTSFEPELICNG